MVPPCANKFTGAHIPSKNPEFASEVAGTFLNPPNSDRSTLANVVGGKAMSAKNPKNVYHIGGLQVEFPYQPYGSQFAFMGRVISTLDRAEREGHCHALLESPTGTGKSLSLLCSSLAWQQNFKLNKVSHPKPAPEATVDPLVFGGGFLPNDVSPCKPFPAHSIYNSCIIVVYVPLGLQN